MINDKSLRSSVLNKFLIKPNDESVVIPKESIANISNGLTSVQNAFNQVKAYSTNISRIQRAIADASLVSKKESALENRAASNVAPVDTGSEIASLFPQLSKALDELAKSFEQLNLSQQGGPGLGAPSPQGGGGMGLGTMLAGGAIAAGIGGAMMFSGSAEAAEPESLPPPTPEPEPEAPVPAPAAEAQPQPSQRPAASEVAAQTQENIAESRAQNEQTPQKIEQRDRRAERLATQTAQAALRENQTAVQRVQAPQPTQRVDRWSDKLSSFIGQSVRATEARIAASGAGGGGGAGDDASYGQEDSGQSYSVGGSYDEKLASLLGNYEGKRLTAYRDTEGIPTIGIGATYYPPGFRLQGRVQMGQTVTDEEAVWIKSKHVEEHRGRLLRSISSSEYNAIPDGAKAALESVVFNYGSLNGTLTQLTKEAVRTRNYRPVSNHFRATLAGHNRGVNSWRRNDEANLIDTGRSSRAGISFGSGTSSITGGSGAGTSGAPGAGGPGGAPGARIGGNIVRRGEGVSGMGYESARGAIQQMGISGTNGNLNSGQLEGIGVGSLKAAPPAARAMRSMRAAAAREGLNIGVTDAYRDYATQVRLKRQKPRLAATPGRSNHGWGLAFDLSDNGRGIQRGSAVHRWLVANAPRFGIYGPLASPFEIWHWEYRGGGASAPATVPVTAPEQQRQANAPTVRTPAGTTMNQSAITAPREQCNCPEPVVVPVGGGGGGNPAATAANYLSGVKPPKQSIKYNVNTAEDYKIYFNAA